MKIKIGGLQKLTLIDYPGKVAATIFLKGCNFRCPFCYNPELVLPEKMKKHPEIPEKEVFAFLNERKGLLQGVCVTGGEPTIHPDLPNFIRQIKKLGYSVKLDTNGSNPEMLKKLIRNKLVDYVAMDVKAIPEKAPSSKFKTAYEKATGVKVNLEEIKKSIEIIKNSGIDYEFRTTVVPGIHTKEEILKLARLIAPAKNYYLQSFRPGKNINQKFAKTQPYPNEVLVEIQNAIAFFFENCRVR